MSEKYPDLLTRASPSSRGVDRRRVLTGALAGGAGLALSPFLPDGLGSGNARAATPKPGGNLRVAITGGGATDTLDAHTMNTSPDLSRVMTLYEGLTTLDNDSKLINVLAESFEPNATATEWTIRLRKGVTFHNGKPFKAEDVAFTFRRIGDPKNPLQGATGLKPVDLDNIKIVDDYTLRVPTKAPFATLPETLSAVYYFGIVPVGYDPKTPVGTGPFKYESFTPGQQSVFTRYNGYWQPGLPISTPSPSSIRSRTTPQPSTPSKAARSMSMPMRPCRSRAR
jgi:peptide/nickel transport system substrate-binding protein